MNHRQAVMLLLVLSSAVSVPGFADSFGKFPGTGNADAYNRSIAPMNEGARKYQERDYESAIRLSKQAIAIYPFDSATHQNLGNALRKTGKLEESIAEQQKAIELEPKYLSAWLGLGLSYEAMNKFFDAEKCYRKCVEIKPDSYSALGSLGNVLREQGKITEARNCFLRAKSCPNSKNFPGEIEKALLKCDEQEQRNKKKEASN